MVNFSLEGKIAVVTGASRGIGEAVAITLADRGAYCILISRKIEGLERVANIINENGGKAEAIACHMGYPDRIAALFEEVKSRHKRLDILINNAATNPYMGPMIDAEESIVDKIFEVNYKGPLFMIQKAVKLMKTTGGGTIVNVASVQGLGNSPMQGVYASSKAALISMTKTLANELAEDNIRVNALLPGLVGTKLATTIKDDPKLLDAIPMHRAAQPMEMAGAVIYLVSEASSYTTGACLICDGGLMA